MLISEVLYYENFDIDSLVTPVKVKRLEALLKETNYNEAETQFTVNGFRHRFAIGYHGNINAKLTAPNLRLKNSSESIVLWNKVMTEVKLKRYAGPFSEMPFKDSHYIQSLSD